MDWFDDLTGGFDLIDRFQSWIFFAFAPQSKRAKYGRLDLVAYRIPRGDKDGVQAGSEVLAYLKHFGVNAVFTGYDSQTLWFDVRRNQKRWTDTLLNVDGRGIPRLDYGRKNWEEKRRALKAQRRQAKSRWLDKMMRGIWG